MQVLTHELNNSELITRYDVVSLAVDALPTMTIALYLKAPVTYDVRQEVRGIQQQIVQAFVQHFSVEPEYINIIVKGIK